MRRQGAAAVPARSNIRIRGPPSVVNAGRQTTAVAGPQGDVVGTGDRRAISGGDVLNIGFLLSLPAAVGGGGGANDFDDGAGGGAFLSSPSLCLFLLLRCVVQCDRLIPRLLNTSDSRHFFRIW